MFGLVQSFHWCIPPPLVGLPRVMYVGGRFSLPVHLCNAIVLVRRARTVLLGPTEHSAVILHDQFLQMMYSLVGPVRIRPTCTIYHLVLYCTLGFWYSGYWYSYVGTYRGLQPIRLSTHSLLWPLLALLSTQQWAETPFTTPIQRNNPR
jgi:hypothetical protein